jgi:hypothetical protein
MNFGIRILLAIFALTFSAQGFAQSVLDDLAFDLGNQARQLQFSTRAFEENRISKQQLENDLNNLSAMVDSYRRQLALSNGGGGDISECTRALINMSFSQSEAGRLCVAARPNQDVLPSCARSLINMSFSQAEAGNVCVAAGRDGDEVSSCARSLINMSFSQVDAGQACLRARTFTDIFTSCTRELINMSFSQAEAGQACAAAGPNSSYPSCVRNLINQSFSHQEAARNCR